MATKQEQLRSALLYLLEKVIGNAFGRDDEINKETFSDELDEMIEDIETTLR